MQTRELIEIGKICSYKNKEIAFLDFISRVTTPELQNELTFKVEILLNTEHVTVSKIVVALKVKQDKEGQNSLVTHILFFF